MNQQLETKTTLKKLQLDNFDEQQNILPKSEQKNLRQFQKKLEREIKRQARHERIHGRNQANEYLKHTQELKLLTEKLTELTTASQPDFVAIQLLKNDIQKAKQRINLDLRRLDNVLLTDPTQLDE